MLTLTKSQRWDIFNITIEFASTFQDSVTKEHIQYLQVL